MTRFFLILGGQDHGTDQHALESRVEGRHARRKAGQISRFFGIYFAGVVKSEDVMGGGEAVEAALGRSERMEGRAAGVDQAGKEFGSDRFARIMRRSEEHTSEL